MPVCLNESAGKAKMPWRLKKVVSSQLQTCPTPQKMLVIMASSPEMMAVIANTVFRDNFFGPLFIKSSRNMIAQAW